MRLFNFILQMVREEKNVLKSSSLKMLKFIFILLLQIISSKLGSALKCEPDEFLCNDRRQCIPKYRWCEGNRYSSGCSDGSDEQYCGSRNCGPAYGHHYFFKCDNGQCIPIEGKCDGYPSCSDGSDELECPCENILEETGSIAFKVRIGTKRSFKCWIIDVPSAKYLVLNVTSFHFTGSDCSSTYLTMAEEKSSSDPIKLCPNSVSNNHLTERFYTTVLKYRGAIRSSYNGQTDSFYLSFTIADLLCKRPDSIKCTPNSCVPPEKKCDGVEDCLNGADERGCERGVNAVPGVNVTLEAGVHWLKEQRNAAWGWRDDTHRAVVALYLAHGANFNGSDQEEDLTAKQLELQMMTAILRNETDPIPSTQLAMFVNALLVICHDPRNFYGFNLVRILHNQMEMLKNAPDHPLPYLALCNANETLSNATIEKLSSILESSSEHSFLMDVQSVAVMALSCMSRKGNFSYLKANINETINKFKKGQNEDGSFGNIYTTALVIQALLSSGNEEAKDWDLKAAIEFLQRRQNKANGSFDDFLATTLILPILNAKSLSDIGNINCTENLKMPRDGNPVSDIEHRLGQKISVKYCLYIGDEKDQMHPISLRTPTNVTVLDVMRLAAEADPKYRFEYQSSNSKLYIYKISGISNDPEDGKFWLLYTKTENKTLEITSKSADKLAVHDKDNIVMWYRSAAIEQSS